MDYTIHEQAIQKANNHLNRIENCYDEIIYYVTNENFMNSMILQIDENDSTIQNYHLRCQKVCPTMHISRNEDEMDTRGINWEAYTLILPYSDFRIDSNHEGWIIDYDIRPYRVKPVITNSTIPIFCRVNH